MTFPVGDVLTDDALAVLALVFFILWHPLNQLAAEPETLSLDVVKFVSDIADAVFDPVPPGASIRLIAKLPNVGTFTVSLIVLEFTLVLSRAIEPFEAAAALLFIVHP